MTHDDCITHPVAMAERLDQIVEELAAWEGDATHTARPYVEMAGDLLHMAVMNMRFPGRYSVTLREAVEEGAVRVIAGKMCGERELTP